MGKLASYVAGVTALLVLAYYVLSRDYSLLIGWLGPIFGSNVIFPLSIAYMLVGNALKFPMLFLVWIVIGVIVGIIARKGSKAMGSAIAIYFTAWLFLLVSGVVLILGVVNGPLSSGLSTLPPLPSGTSVDAVLREPLLQEILAVVLQISGISLISGSTVPQSPSLMSFVQANVLTFLPYVILNLAILLVTAYFVGRFFHSTFYKEPKSKEPLTEGKGNKKKANRKNNSKVSGKVKTTLLVVILMLTLSSFYMANPFVEQSFSQGTSATSNGNGTPLLQDYGYNDYNVGMASLNNSLESTNYILQAASSTNSSYNASSFDSLYYGGGVLGTYGNLYNMYAFMKKESSPTPNFLGPNSTSGSLFTFVALSDNISRVFDYLGEDSILNISTVSVVSGNQLYNLIPQTVIVDAFLGNITKTRPTAQSLASNITRSIGSSSPKEIIGIPLSVDIGNNQNTNLSLYIFSSISKTYKVENNVLNLASSEFPNDGPMSPFVSGISSGYLVPGHTSNSMETSIFLVGDLNIKYFGTATSSFVSPFNSGGFLNDTQSVLFMGGIFAKSNVAHSSPSTHVFSASQIFNYDGTLSFTNNKTVYALSLTYPDANGSTIAGTGKYKTVFYVTLANLSIPLGTSSNSTQVVQNYGSNLGLQSVSIQTNVTFPADLAVNQSYRILSYNKVEVQIIVQNNDTEEVNNLILNGNRFLSSYPGGYTLVNGTTSLSQGALQPGSSVTLQYTLNLKGVGAYIISSPQLNYSLNGTSFSVVDKQQTITASYPFVLTSVNNIALTSFSFIANFTSAHFLVQKYFNGFYFFDLIPVLFIVLAIYLEYRSYRKWRSKKSST